MSPKTHLTKPDPELGAQLTYYIFEGVLIGYAGGQPFHLTAASGGGGGSKKHQPDFGGVFHPYTTHVKTTKKGEKHKHGGAIPLGKYIIYKPAKHPHLGLSAYLEPAKSNKMMTRGGFFIHGRGKHGSDGCIVPLSSFDSLMEALTRDATGVLHVLEAMGGVRFA